MNKTVELCVCHDTMFEMSILPQVKLTPLPETHSSWFSHLCHPPVGDVTPREDDQVTLATHSSLRKRGMCPHLLNVAGGQVLYLWRMYVVSAAWPAPGRGPRRGMVSHLLCYPISMFRVQESVYRDGKQNRWIGKGYPFSFLIMEKLERGKKQSKGACTPERERCSLRLVLCWPARGLLIWSYREGNTCRISATMGARLERGVGLVTGIPNKEDVLPTKWTKDLKGKIFGARYED